MWSSIINVLFMTAFFLFVAFLLFAGWVVLENNPDAVWFLLLRGDY